MEVIQKGRNAKVTNILDTKLPVIQLFCGCVSCCAVSVVLSVLFLLFVLLFLLLKPANTLLGHCYFLLRCLYCFCCLLGSVRGVAFSLGVPP